MNKGFLCTDPDCGHYNLPDAKICDACDLPLPAKAEQGWEAGNIAPRPTAASNAVDEAKSERCECQEPMEFAPATCVTCGLLGIEPYASTPDQEFCKPIPAEPPQFGQLPPLQLRFGTGSVVRFDDSLVLGRGYPAIPPLLAEWIDKHGGISRRHCLLMVEVGRLSVIDLGSKNGTKANDTALRAGRAYSLEAAELPHRLALGRYAQLVIEAREEQL